MGSIWSGHPSPSPCRLHPSKRYLLDLFAPINEAIMASNRFTNKAVKGLQNFLWIICICSINALVAKARRQQDLIH